MCHYLGQEGWGFELHFGSRNRWFLSSLKVRIVVGFEVRSRGFCVCVFFFLWLLCVGFVDFLNKSFVLFLVGGAGFCC